MYRGGGGKDFTEVGDTGRMNCSLGEQGFGAGKREGRHTKERAEHVLGMEV